MKRAIVAMVFVSCARPPDRSAEIARLQSEVAQARQQLTTCRALAAARDAGAVDAGTAPIAVAAAPAPVSSWTYHDVRDEMRNAATHIGCLRSTNTLEFDAPYEGAQHARICFRNHADGSLAAWVDIEAGQFLCSIYSCPLRAKFDDGAVLPVRASEAAGGTTTLIFINDAARFLASTRTAHRIVLETSFFHEGSRQLIFADASGLVWPAVRSRRVPSTDTE